jgi:alkylation response protein AidB-like acyl-CoA dehydrogenase
LAFGKKIGGKGSEITGTEETRMDFNLNEDQLLLQRTLKKFTEREIEPIAAQIDRDEKMPDGLIKKMAGMGLFGMPIPKKYGGGDADNLSVIIACEEVAYSGTGAWWSIAFNNSIPETIHKYGSEEIREKYLRPLCDGTACSSIQFTEENTGSDPRALITTAVPEGDGYVINGMKRFSTFGGRDGYAMLFTKDETGRCTAFVIPKNGPGYSVTKGWELMGGGGMETVDVYLENMKVPAKNLLGEKGKGFDVLLYWISIEKIEQCAASVGMAQAALDEAVKYAKARVVREKPMTAMQGIQWMLADIYTRIEAARWLTYRTAFLQDQGDPNWMTEAAGAKMFVMPTILQAIDIARQIHGGYGYSREFKIERIYRAAAGATAIATSLEINRSIVGAWLGR